MKNLVKFFAFIALVSVASTSFAKVSFKLLKEYNIETSNTICGDFCLGGCSVDGNSEVIDWVMKTTIMPNAPQADKDKLIANYQTCLEMGLPFIKENYLSIKTLVIMIPKGLFLTEKEGTYDEKMRFSDPKKEDKTNFDKFVAIATPILEKHFETLTVKVWQENPKK